MSLFVVTDKATGEELYRYQSDTPIEWSGMEFSTHNHIELDLENPIYAIDPAQWRIFVGAFFDRFGSQKLPILSSTDPLIQAAIVDCTVRKYIDLHTRRPELEQLLTYIQGVGFPVDVTTILDVVPTADEVWHA